MYHEPIANFKPEYYPTGDISQFFGENKELYSKTVCHNGFCMQGHNGWDIVRRWGTPILAVEDGVVCETKEDTGGYGKHVRILSGTNEWTYGHLSEITCKLNQAVQAGDVIGKMGNTGFVVSGSTPYWKYNPYAGTHLHLCRRIVRRSGKTNVVYSSGHKVFVENYLNGFFGAVDFLPNDFTAKVEEQLKASDKLALLGAKALAEGNNKQASIYFAVAAFVRSFEE